MNFSEFKIHLALGWYADWNPPKSQAVTESLSYMASVINISDSVLSSLFSEYSLRVSVLVNLYELCGKFEFSNN